MKILKYILNPKQTEQTIVMPSNAEILSAQLRGKDLCIWAIVNTDENLRKRCFLIVETGKTIDGRNKRFIASVDMQAFTVHVFELNVCIQSIEKSAEGYNHNS
jgi:hypothetical protein